MRLAFEKTGSLYVGNYGSPSGSLTSTVSVYGPGGGQPTRTISQGIRGPYAIAFGPSGKFTWPTMAAARSRSIRGDRTRCFRRSPRTCDRPKRLPSTVTAIFTSRTGQAAPLRSTLRVRLPPLGKISVGVSYPDALAFDSARNLYVANHAANSVTVYAPGHKQTPRTIRKGVREPLSLISTPTKQLYVLNYSNNTVSVYSEDTLALEQVISTGIACPTTMARSKTGLLYVANACPSSVSVYSSSGKQLRSIRKGLDGPVAIGVAP